MNLRLSIYICFCISLAFGEEIKRQLRGVNPKDYSLYSGESFLCKDESEMLDISKVNDDFCDCPDGSDEPGTSACPKGVFYCVNKGHTPKELKSSHVNDGICDCCDGSDEYSGVVTCSNTCEQVKNELEQSKAALEKTYKDGSNILKTWMSQAVFDAQVEKETYGLKQRKLNDFEVQKRIVQRELETITETMDADTPRDQKVEDMLIKKELIDLSKRFHLNNLSTTKLSFIIYKLISESQDPAQSMMTLRKTVDQMTGLYGDVMSPSAVPSSLKIHIDSESESESLTDEESDDGVDKEAIMNQLIEEKLNIDGVTVDMVKSAVALVDMTKFKGNDNIAKMNEQMDRLDTAMNQLQSDIKSLTKYKYYGPKNEFFMMKGMCAEDKVKGYMYKVCPFGEAYQDSVLLGDSFSIVNAKGVKISEIAPTSVDLTNPTTEKYYFRWDEGTSCWNGETRSLQVEVVCGSKLEVLKITEPSMCKYEGVMSTPSACPP